MSTTTDTLARFRALYGANHLYTIAHGSHVRAFGRPTGHGKQFLVFAGSVASARESDGFRTDPDSKARRYRTFLLEEKVLVPVDGRLVFATDFVFPSPSNAATVILGNPSDGYAWWKKVI